MDRHGRCCTWIAYQSLKKHDQCMSTLRGTFSIERGSVPVSARQCVVEARFAPESTECKAADGHTTRHASTCLELVAIAALTLCAGRASSLFGRSRGSTALLAPDWTGPTTWPCLHSCHWCCESCCSDCVRNNTLPASLPLASGCCCIKQQHHPTCVLRRFRLLRYTAALTRPRSEPFLGLLPLH